MGHLWAQQGYLAILVDGFGPRGFPHGFAAGTHDQRPASLNEVTVRPLDAYGALVYLRTRNDVLADRIVLQGWSNGASATLAAMSSSTAALKAATPATGFRGAVAFYPGCGLDGHFDKGLLPYAPVRIFVGSNDNEIDPQRCEHLVSKSVAEHADLALKLYPEDPRFRRSGREPPEHPRQCDGCRGRDGRCDSLLCRITEAQVTQIETTSCPGGEKKQTR